MPVTDWLLDSVSVTGGQCVTDFVQAVCNQLGGSVSLIGASSMSLTMKQCVTDLIEHCVTDWGWAE